MRQSPVRLALVGRFGAAVSCPDMAARLRNGSITVVVESDAAVARSTAGSVGASIVVRSLEAALARYREEFDAVVLQAPLRDRGALTRRAVEAGKHVFVEAPIGESLAEAESTLDVFSGTSACLGIGKLLRFLPSNQAIMSRLSEGKLGTPGLLRVHRWRCEEVGASVGPVERVFADIDLASWLFGSKPTEIHACGRGGTAHSRPTRESPEYLQIHLGFPDGGMALLDSSITLPSGDGYDSLSLIGSCGAAYADDHHNTQLLYRGGAAEALVSRQGHLHFVGELQDFVDAIASGRQAQVSVEDGRRAHRVTDAVLRSLDSGRVLHEKGGGYAPCEGP